jgi:hypothetical protein
MKICKKSPREFKAAFLKAVAHFDSDVLNLWSDYPNYTKLMLGEIFPKIAEELDMLVWNENYYYLDSILYAEKDIDHFGDKTYAKYIGVAMEHEHVIDGTAVEMNKLQLFNAPLKVLITYASGDGIQWGLDIYTKIIQDADIFGDFATLRRQLVIFGSISEKKIVTWHFYAYEPTGFQEIKDI